MAKSSTYSRSGRPFYIPIATWLTLIPMEVFALDDKIFDMSLEQLGQIEVTVATGTSLTIHQAPSAVSVITAGDLAAMGAQSIDEALENVPGVHVTHSGIVMAPRYFIRGITSANNPQTLVLVNGLPMTSLWQGDRSPAWRGVPVAAIRRIEIIRGPGSAVYGADAFAGIINIITKSAEEVADTHATVSQGSFHTTQASLLNGQQWGDAHSALMLSWHRTEGDKGLIDSDAQSSIDMLGLGPPASKAPGPVNRSVRDLDARWDLALGHWRLRASWQEAWDIGTGQGIAYALDPLGKFDARFGDMDLLWDNPTLSQNWNMSSRLSYGYKSFSPQSNILFYPPGAFGGSFPMGVIDNPSLGEENIRFEQSAVFSGFETQRVRLGVGYYWGNLFYSDEKQNYSISASQPVPTPLPGGLTDVKGTPLLFQPTGKRSDIYGFLQDEWTLVQDWQLTAGFREDHYSDFGSSLNPRIAMVWNASDAVITRLTYGEAFRAPSFAELFVNSNPVNLGNPALKPEKLKSTELSLTYQKSRVWNVDVNFYALRVRDFITYAPEGDGSTFKAQNLGRVAGHGAETTWRWHGVDSVLLQFSLSTQATMDENSRQPLGGFPSRKGNLALYWNVQPQWQVYADIVAVGRRLRAAEDPRPALGGYTSYNLTLSRLALPHAIGVTISTKNLFNTRIREPSPGPGPGQSSPSIPGDLPEPGRNIIVAATMDW